jgi:hypothetical protein
VVTSVVMSSTALILVVTLAVIVTALLCHVRKLIGNADSLTKTTTLQGNICKANSGRTHCDVSTVMAPSNLQTATPRDRNRDSSSSTIVFPLSSDYYESAEYRSIGEIRESNMKMEKSSTQAFNYQRLAEERFWVQDQSWVHLCLITVSHYYAHVPWKKLTNYEFVKWNCNWLYIHVHVRCTNMLMFEYRSIPEK